MFGNIIRNTNSGNACSAALGTFTSTGYNLASDASCNAIHSNDLGTSDPLLNAGGLADNGGPTQTILLQSSSPAKDAIPAADCSLTTDQRGTARPQNGDCDVGAVEM
ncbi:MAG: choice-of-anchor Q domain-containing protein [Bdellovibrionales bacterium]